MKNINFRHLKSFIEKPKFFFSDILAKAMINLCFSNALKINSNNLP